MKEETWQALENFFSKASILKAEPVNLDEIAAAESKVGIRLSADYAEFIARYGGAIVGPFRIFGLRRAAAMGVDEGSFVEVTTAFRKKEWPGVDGLIVFSMDHGGNPVGIDGQGKVWISDHDKGGLQIIANNFEEYIRRQCLEIG